MRRFAAVSCLALGLAVLPRVASADPIGTNSCGDVGGVNTCDIWANFGSNSNHGPSALGIAEGNLGSYLLGYLVLLNTAADLSDGSVDVTDVSQVLVIHDSLFELFEQRARFSAVGVFHRRHREHSGEQMFRIVARVDLLKPRERLQHQTRSDQQNQGQRDF